MVMMLGFSGSKRARLPHFPSILKLVLFGFALAILPLLVALFSALYSLEKLTDYSQLTVFQAVRKTKSSRVLLEKLTTMERSAKQYLVLEDPVFLQAYEIEHNEFTRELRDLVFLTEEKSLETIMNALAAKEFELYRQILSDQMSNEEKIAATSAFQDLNELAQELWQKSILMIGQEVDELEKNSQGSQHMMLINAAIMLPITIALVVIFVYLIVRPVRQLDWAIRKLGDRDFDQPIRVKGPRDLEYLGERLDWLRRRLRALEEEKQRFLRSVSHELKTPLATIHEGVELLADEVVGELNAEQTDIAGILLNSSNRLDRLIEDLINYSHLQSQQSELIFEKIHVHKLIQSVVNDYQIRLRANNIRLQTSLKPLKTPVVAEKLRTIVDNLLSNAVKYSPNGGQIRISLNRAGDHMQLEIEDDGPGIPPDERKQVFNAFFQGSASRRAGIRGTGLGLAIVRECVVLHRGHIEVLDPRPDKQGAYFRIHIPLDLRNV